MKTDKSLGDLMVESGLISQTCQRDRLTLSKQLGMPVRQILIYSGDVSKEHVYAALELFSLVQDSLLQFDLAVLVLKDISERNLPIRTALRKVGFDPDKKSSLLRLGDLLRAAECIEDHQLQEALQASKDAACPFGHSLILLGFVHPAVIGAALTVQQGLRDKTIRSSPEAVMRLKKEIDFLRQSGQKINAPDRSAEWMVQAGG